MAKDKQPVEKPEEKPVEKPEETKKDKQPVEKPEEKPVERLKTKKELMKEHLDKQPKVSIIIPLEGKEKEGAFETVQLNGYTYQIMKGQYVSVPKQIAEIIMDSQKQTALAIANALKRLPDDERLTFDNSQS